MAALAISGQGVNEPPGAGHGRSMRVHWQFLNEERVADDIFHGATRRRSPSRDHRHVIFFFLIERSFSSVCRVLRPEMHQK